MARGFANKRGAVEYDTKEVLKEIDRSLSGIAVILLGILIVLIVQTCQG